MILVALIVLLLVVLAILLALVYCWDEPVRRCGYMDFTRRPR